MYAQGSEMRDTGQTHDQSPAQRTAGCMFTNTASCLVIPARRQWGGRGAQGSGEGCYSDTLDQQLANASRIQTHKPAARLIRTNAASVCMSVC